MRHMRPGRKAGFNWQEKVLGLLIETGGMRPRDIKKTLGISNAQLARVLKKLSEAGLIVKRNGFYYPTVQTPPKEKYRSEVALLHALELLRARLNTLASFYFKARSPYLRIPLDVYRDLFPEKRIIYGPMLMELELEEVLRDEEKLRVLENHGILKTKRKKTEHGEIIEELHFRESHHPQEPGLFYKPVGRARWCEPTQEEILEIISDFITRTAEIARAEAERILREHDFKLDTQKEG